MKAFIRRFLAVFLSLIIVIAPTIQQANAASNWGITKAVSSGARVIVTATNSGYKSAINIAPTAGRIGVRILKGANTAAWLYAAIQIANDGIDFVLEPENNRVRYKSPTETDGRWWTSVYGPNSDYETKEEAAKAGCRVMGGFLVSANYAAGTFVCNKGGDLNTQTLHQKGGQPLTKYIPVPTLAEKILQNAASYHSASQTAVRETATDMVIAGDFDADLMTGAVPISDNKPLIPSVPGTTPNNNGDITTGADPGNQSMSPGQTAADAAAARDAAKAAADAAAQAAKDAAADAQTAADDAKDLINQAIDQAIKDLAAQAAKDAAAAAQAAKDTANAAAIAAAEAAKTAAEAAAAVSAQAAKDLAAAQAANDAAAIAAAEAAKAAAEAALADAEAKAEAAEKAAEKAKAEAAKPFELPAFCTWAAIVCETAEWLKREPETPEITAIETDSPIDDFDSDKSYITFTGSCPPKYTASLSIMGATAPFEFDYTPICTVMSYLKPFIVGAGYMAAAYIIAGHSRGSKD